MDTIRSTPLIIDEDLPSHTYLELLDDTAFKPIFIPPSRSRLMNTDTAQHEVLPAKTTLSKFAHGVVALLLFIGL